MNGLRVASVIAIACGIIFANKRAPFIVQFDDDAPAINLIVGERNQPSVFQAPDDASGRRGIHHDGTPDIGQRTRSCVSQRAKHGELRSGELRIRTHALEQQGMRLIGFPEQKSDLLLKIVARDTIIRSCRLPLDFVGEGEAFVFFILRPL